MGKIGLKSSVMLLFFNMGSLTVNWSYFNRPSIYLMTIYITIYNLHLKRVKTRNNRAIDMYKAALVWGKRWDYKFYTTHFIN